MVALNSKPFLLPFWIMASITIVKATLIILATIAFHRMMERTSQPIPNSLYGPDWLMVFAMAIETTIYFIIRKKIFRRSWAYIHVFCCLFALIIIPFIYAFLPVIVSNFFPSVSLIEILTVFSTIRFFIFAALMIIAHVFFILLLAVHKKPNNEPDDEVSDTTEVY